MHHLGKKSRKLKKTQIIREKQKDEQCKDGMKKDHEN
jgi:hypothetical protein